MNMLLVCGHDWPRVRGNLRDAGCLREVAPSAEERGPTIALEYYTGSRCT